MLEQNKSQAQAPVDHTKMPTMAHIPRYHAKRAPHAEAISFEGRKTDWATFDQATERAGQALSTIAKPGERICYVGKNSDEFFVLFIGAAKAGIVMVPIIWRLVPAEIGHIVTDSEAKALFIAPDQFGNIEKLQKEIPAGCPVMSLEQKHPGLPYFQDWVEQNAKGQKLPEITPDMVVLQLYTSGTTGKPKGVMLNHNNMIESRRESREKMMPWYQWSTDDVSLVALPMGHIGGVGWGNVAFLNGSRTIVQREFTPAGVLEAIDKGGVTKLFLVPTTIQMVLMQPNIKEIDFSRLKTVLYGAAPIALDLLREAKQVFGCDFCQQYGATETCGTIAYLPPEDHDVNGNRRMRSAGLPMPGIQVRITSPGDRKVLGPNEVGEIETKSVANMVGYWKLPEETARTITPDGWLRTGDAGYLDEDGYIYIYDRFKDMICTGAENVYPAEVESAVYGHPAVQEVAVIGVPDDKWGESVKAIIVPKPGAVVDEADIIAFARTRIAAFKAPKSVDIVAELPRNASGKILRRVLREPYWAGKDRRVN